MRNVIEGAVGAKWSDPGIPGGAAGSWKPLAALRTPLVGRRSTWR